MSRAGVLLPGVAGTWYPANASDLARCVDALLDPPDAPAAAVRGRGLVVPHAGLAYSGGVAGLGFRTLSRDPRRVLLVGPTHHVAFRGAVVPRSTAYRTPLGDVPIDVDAVEQLARCDGVRRDDVPFGPEHSLEVELPFLQRHLLPGWCVLPVLVGAIRDAAVRESVVAALRPVRDAGTSTVVSSDFTHYGPRFGYVPFTDRVAERIRELDHGAIECVVRSDADGFRQYIERTGATICGHAPIELWLEMLEPGTRGALVAYDTSGRITGDPGHSVSYASIVFP